LQPPGPAEKGPIRHARNGRTVGVGSGAVGMVWGATGLRVRNAHALPRRRA
jgi:hypothetical protein